MREAAQHLPGATAVIGPRVARWLRHWGLRGQRTYSAAAADGELIPQILPEDRNRVAHRDQFLDPRRIPVRGADAAVAGGAANRLRVVRPVNADVRFVQPHPEN